MQTPSNSTVHTIQVENFESLSLWKSILNLSIIIFHNSDATVCMANSFKTMIYCQFSYDYFTGKLEVSWNIHNGEEDEIDCKRVVWYTKKQSLCLVHKGTSHPEHLYRVYTRHPFLVFILHMEQKAHGLSFLSNVGTTTWPISCNCWNAIGLESLYVKRLANEVFNMRGSEKGKQIRVIIS